MRTLSCNYCGRAVRETIHRRSGYSVGYYLMRTGPTAEVSLRGNDEEDEVVTFLKLVSFEEVVSCADCYAKPGVKKDFERWGYDPAGSR